MNFRRIFTRTRYPERQWQFIIFPSTSNRFRYLIS